jgi:hypothetical protein
MDSGLRVMANTAFPTANPTELTIPEVSNLQRGDFFLFRPEWVFGPFQTMAISGGVSAGNYFVQPRVNFAPVSIFFNGESLERGRRRFGSGVISYHADWLEVPGTVVKPTPNDVKQWFKRLVEHLSSGVIVTGGVNAYLVCRGVLADPELDECLPPFDFIEWISEHFKEARDARKRTASRPSRPRRCT